MKYIHFLRLIILLSLIAKSPLASAAPHPGTATSTLVSPALGVFRSPLGFQISAGASGWVQSEAPHDNKFIAAVYTAPTKIHAAEGGSLTIRIDKLSNSTGAKNTNATSDVTLEKYVQRWMKEYPKYGFDVLGSSPFTQEKDKGYVLDLINRDNGRQLRQVVFLKNQRAVILTCRDQSSTFKDSLKSCNQIIRTFSWTE